MNTNYSGSALIVRRKLKDIMTTQTCKHSLQVPSAGQVPALALAPCSALDSLYPEIQEWENNVGKWRYTYQRAEEIAKATDQSLRLLCGEMTAREIRSVRAVVNFILPNSKDEPRPL